MTPTGINITLAGRTIEFWMNLDPTDLRDASMWAYLARNMPPEPEVVHLMMRAVREGDTVIDGGANIGYFTLLLSRLVGPSGRVIAVEPSPPNLAKLRANLEINGIRNVEVVPKALWSQAGETLDFHLTDLGGYDSLARSERTTGTIQVETTTLRGLMPSNGIVSLIKLDLEGAEAEALNEGTFGLFTVVETQELLADDICAAMSARDAFVLHPNGSLPSLIPAGAKLLPKAENSNLLFSQMYYVAQAWPEVIY